MGEAEHSDAKGGGAGGDIGRAFHGSDRKYLLLFVMLLLALIVQSFSAHHSNGVIVSDFAVTVGLAFVFFVLFPRRRLERSITLVVGMLALGAQWLHHATSDQVQSYLQILYHSLMAVFFVSAVHAVLRDLFRRRRAGETNIFGALSGYLMAGAAFGNLHSLAYLLAPGSYRISQEVLPYLHGRHGLTVTMTHYSFTQLMTIGYSDITAIVAPATTIGMLEAMFGIFYLAVVVSQFVSEA